MRPTKKQIAKMRAEWEAEDRKEAKKHVKEPIYRGMRGGIGAPPDDEASKALEKMIGATIVDVGFVKTCKEGGLTFDFDKDGKKKRLVLGYNELGEWVEFLGERK